MYTDLSIHIHVSLCRATYTYYRQGHTYRLLECKMQPLKSTAWGHHLLPHVGNRRTLQTPSRIEDFFSRIPKTWQRTPASARDRASNWPKSPGAPTRWPSPALSISSPRPIPPIRCEPVPARGPASQQSVPLQAGPPGGARAQPGGPLRPHDQ